MGAMYGIQVPVIAESVAPWWGSGAAALAVAVLGAVTTVVIERGRRKVEHLKLLTPSLLEEAIDYLTALNKYEVAVWRAAAAVEHFLAEGDMDEAEALLRGRTVINQHSPALARRRIKLKILGSTEDVEWYASVCAGRLEKIALNLWKLSTIKAEGTEAVKELFRWGDYRRFYLKFMGILHEQIHF